MKKVAFIALLALTTSLTLYAECGKKKNRKKDKAKIECCEKSKCSKDEKPGCCDQQPTCCIKKS